MNYDKIILELLDRIKILEEQVAVLMDKENKATSSNKVSTADIRAYIEGCKTSARSQNKDVLVLVAGDIHKDLQLKSAMPMVCNAMRQCMHTEDVVLYETASGYSSTLKIEYKV